MSLQTTIANYNALKAARNSKGLGTDQIQRIMAIRALKDLLGGEGLETDWFVDYVINLHRIGIDKAIDQLGIQFDREVEERALATAAFGDRDD